MLDEPKKLYGSELQPGDVVNVDGEVFAIIDVDGERLLVQAEDQRRVWIRREFIDGGET